MPQKVRRQQEQALTDPLSQGSRLKQNGQGTRLTQRLATEAEASDVKQRIPDHEVKGLFLRITPTGAKSYVLRYSHEGRRGEAVIGDARALTLVTARAKAMDMLNSLTLQRIDPVQAKQAAIVAERQRRNASFAALAEVYSKDAARRKRPKTLEFETWLLNKHILPKLGQRPYAELRRSEIIAFIETIGDKTGQITANRAHAIIRQILNYALKRDLIGANPALGIERMFPEVSRERILNESEIRTLWAFLEAARANSGEGLVPGQRLGERPVNIVSPAVATALQLCLLTLQRSGEVAGARIGEFSWKERLWIIPADRMKGKRAHAVPLSVLAMERFQSAFKQAGGEIAFKDRSGEASIDPKRLTRAMNRCCKHLRLVNAGPHDLRRTGRTMMTSEEVGVSYEVAERVIAHLFGSSVSRVYDRNEYLREKRAALDRWEEVLRRIVA
jgi:integrase